MNTENSSEKQQEVEIKVDWNDISKIETKILEAVKSIDVKNIGVADIYLTKKKEELFLRISLKPLEFADTSNTKAVQSICAIEKSEILEKPHGICFRQRKNGRKGRMTTIGVQTRRVVVDVEKT